MSARKVTWEGLSKFTGGNFSKGPGSRGGNMNWFTHNFCTHCQKRVIKGTTQCPDCHLRVRTLPRIKKTEGAIEKLRLYKLAQRKAKNLLLNSGWVMPPPTCGAK